ncbi:hypothetical protein B5F33_04285 [Collinsella sp. An2]|nr:hypothetical protein B5F33_04285 [Collinsella sp. An2]
MTSRKPQARARQRSEFMHDVGDLDALFSAGRRGLNELDARREEAHYEKACGLKKRYDSRADALAAIDACAAHGRRGLSCYKCSYCGGWHLTSHPQRG